MRRIAAVLAALLAVAPLAACGGDDPTYLEDLPDYHRAWVYADVWCTFNSDPVNARPYDAEANAEKRACRNDQIRRWLIRHGHPEAKTAPHRKRD